MKKIIPFLAMALLAAPTFGQMPEDALRFSQVYHSGTARFSAMGGAFAALGGDASSLAFNPAGAGVYRSSEFTFTPHLLRTSTDASYMGNASGDDIFKLGMSNLGVMGVLKYDNDDGLRYLNFGFAYNKTTRFAERSALRGKPVDFGLMEYFKVRADDVGAEKPDETWLAYKTFALDYDTAEKKYLTPLHIGDKTYNEQRTVREGDMGEYDFSMGGNVADVFYFGATFGIVSVDYRKTIVLTETGMPENYPEFRQLNYTRHYGMSGIGYNFKFGIIATPFINADLLNGLRIGAAIHTPTFLGMVDKYRATMVTEFEGEPPYADETPTNEFEYEIETPTKYMAGLAYVFSGDPDSWRGILSADYEYLDYSKIKMREVNDHAFKDILAENYYIAHAYTGTSNLRFGGELGHGRYAFRAGYARYGSPYAGDANKEVVQIFSAGVGVKLGASTTMDFAFTRALQDYKEYLYSSDRVESEQAAYTVAQNNFLLTLQWRF